jgi:DNA polymerase III sliding clamp (beta) subunit (PCNA family)
VSTVIFETAVIQSAVSKASRVAPTKGSAFDKSAGIVLEVQPDEDYPVIIKATDTQTFYMEWLNAIHSEGPSESWRLPSEALDLILQKMPVGSGCQVKMERVPEGIKITAGSKRGTLYVMKMDEYPTMMPYDSSTLVEAPGFIEKITQVEWAADPSGSAPLGYVFLNGKNAMATDRHRLAVSVLEFDTDEPILVQARTLTRVLGKNTNPKVGVDNGMLHIMPDDHTQIRTATYEGSYPNMERLMLRNKPNEIRVRKKDLLDIMEAALTVAGNERFPSMDLHIGRGEIAASLANKSYGLFGDVLSVPGQADHKRTMITITPKLLMDAINQAPDDVIVFGYDLADLRKPLYVNGGSGFEAWVALRGGEDKS